MARGENTSINAVRIETPDEWGMHSKKQIVEGKFVLMERDVHFWGEAPKGHRRPLQSRIQRVFMPPDVVEAKKKKGWRVCEDAFDKGEAMRKEPVAKDASGKRVRVES